MRERGNILFLILLAVVLFAALSYAVTSSMRGGGKSAASEANQGAVAEIMNFNIAVENATQRLMLTNGLKPENVSFVVTSKQWPGTTGTIGNNTNCTTDACRIFRTEGGGVEIRSFEKYANMQPTGYQNGWPMPGYISYTMLVWPQAGTDLNDVVMIINGMKPEICQEYNTRMGITSFPSVGGSWVDPSNTANWDTAAYTLTSNASQVTGKSSFATGQWNGYCAIYQLLIAR